MNRQLFGFKLKHKHAEDFARILLYANQRYYQQYRRKEIESISMGHLRDLLNHKSAYPMVHIVLNIYFERVKRGNSKSKKVSEWKRRDALHINTQISKFACALKMDNTEVVNETWAFCGAKRSEMKIETTVKWNQFTRCEIECIMNLHKERE